ncbi:hypothetical protein U27_01416 [Candidatus Vecturithrix granuli]|uniref:Uncharacterized protein n=1 Tax=Vecturithrix granuli TaxID=1499967 RepID=A0A081CAB0_VECG1|nr:hypothetical protein U27_01416 [Candidatus Vecturithrix granuli]
MMDQATLCENPNKTLEGIKTIILPQQFLLRLRENPNKTLEGIKTFLSPSLKQPASLSENPNKTLEGIKTPPIVPLGSQRPM